MATHVAREEVERLMSEEQAQLVEVLPRREYEDRHIQGALNIPLKQLDRTTAAELDRGRPAIVYCHDYQ
jgi:rhodanese-related sulfurtransferase